MRNTALALSCAAAVMLALPLSGCTAVDSVAIQTGTPREAVQKGQTFVTAGTTSEPHDSLGLVQVVKTGVWLFGNIKLPDTSLEGGYELLKDVVAQRGAHGVVNVRFHTVQYSTIVRILFAFPFFFIPLPGNVHYTGELVKLRPADGASPAPPAAAGAPPVAVPPSRP